jgi:hypothetical protein
VCDIRVAVAVLSRARVLSRGTGARAAYARLTGPTGVATGPAILGVGLGVLAGRGVRCATGRRARAASCRASAKIAGDRRRTGPGELLTYLTLISTSAGIEVILSEGDARPAGTLMEAARSVHARVVRIAGRAATATT